MRAYPDEVEDPVPPDVAAENHRRRLEGCMADAAAERAVLKATLGGMTEILPGDGDWGGPDPVGYGWMRRRGD